MEADSTTYESNQKSSINEICLPFNSSPANLNLYKELVSDNGDRSLESQLISKLQAFGLLPTSISCPEDASTCKVVRKLARVIDRVQWVCEGCGKRQPIRTGSFFFKLQCSILQVLQLVLAWCEDADLTSAAQYFDVKPRVANIIYDKLDELVIKELNKSRLGGENSVVVSEMYPDYLNRLSPDTTEQPHVHRILMLADTKHIPTHYRLHVVREDLKKPGNINEQGLKDEIEHVVANTTAARSTLVAGGSVPLTRGAVPLQALLQHCDAHMRHFLSSRVWRQAVCVCAASREVCAGSDGGAGGGGGGGGGGGVPALGAVSCLVRVQRYLDASMYRLRYGDGFYQRVLRMLGDEYTQMDTAEVAPR